VRASASDTCKGDKSVILTEIRWPQRIILVTLAAVAPEVSPVKTLRARIPGCGSELYRQFGGRA